MNLQWFERYGQELLKIKDQESELYRRCSGDKRAYFDFRLLVMVLNHAVRVRYHEFTLKKSGYLHPVVHELLNRGLYQYVLGVERNLCVNIEQRLKTEIPLLSHLTRSLNESLDGDSLRKQILADFEAIESERVSDLKNILLTQEVSTVHAFLKHQDKPYDLNRTYLDEYGTTSLRLAAGLKKIDLMAYLIKQGADVNAMGYGRKTALTELMVDNESSIFIVNKQAEEKRVQTFNENVKAGMELLISHGASINGLFQASAGTKGLHSPLTYAIYHGIWGAVQVLLNHNAALTRYAVNHSKLCKDQKSLDEAAEICDQNEQGLTPLMLAVQEENADACALLLKQTSDESLENTKGVVEGLPGVGIWDMAKNLDEKSPCRQLLLQRKDRRRAEALLQVGLLEEQALVGQAVPEKAEPVLHFFNSQIFDINLMGLVMEYAKDNTLRKEDEQKDNDEQKENEEFVITTSMLGANSY